MKKISLLLIVFVISIVAVFAQSKSSAIKINPLSAIVATGNVQFEQAVSETSSVQLGVFYIGATISETRFTGFGITPEYRFYLGNGEALDGFFVAPFLRYQSFTLEDDISASKGNLSTFGGGAILGRQWLAGDAFVIDLFIGPSYSGGNISVENGDEEDFSTGLFTGLGVRWGIVLGFAF